jgi:signal transduction histidine kinase
MLDVKRNLIRFLSHEIRTPLNSVNMGLMIIKRELAGYEEGRVIDCRDLLSVVEEIENSSSTSLDILNDLLTYEKIDAGILMLQKDIVTAYSIVQESLRPFLLHVCN